MAELRVIVTLDVGAAGPCADGIDAAGPDAGGRSIDDVAAALRHAGMHIDSVLGAIGIITGTVAVERLPALTVLSGVVSVDEQADYRLPPADSDIQ